MAATLPNVTGIGYTPGNVDLATQQAALDRKRQIMQAMMLQAMQQQGGTQMAGNIAIRNSPMAPLASLLQSMGAQRGMGKLDDQERELIQQKQQQASDAVQALMQAAQPQAGTPTKITEQPGPPDEQGVGSYSVQEGTPGGFDMPGFSKAYAGAQYAGVDPNVLGSMLQQFNRGRLLTQMGYGNMVPGAQQQQPTMTPGNANGGAQVTMPVGGGGGAPQGSGFGGVPAQAAALTISGDPALEKLGAMMNEQAKPISGRAGAPLWTRDANGNVVMGGFSPSVEKGQTVDAQGRVSTAPGFVDSAKEVLGATSSAQAAGAASGAAPYKLVTVHLSDGSTAQVPESSLLPAMNAGAAPTQAGGMTDSQARAFAISQDRAGKPVDVVANPGGSFTPQAATFNRSQSTSAKAFQEAQGSDTAKQFQAYNDAADAATTGRATVASMKDALNGFSPNAAAPARQKLAEWAQALPGVTPDQVKRIAGGDIAAMQEFGKLAFGNSVTGLRALVGPGQRISQMEMMTNYANSPNPSLQKAAIQTMLEIQDGGYRWAQERQQQKDAWLAAGKDPNAFGGWWNRNHPLASGKDADGNPYIPSMADVRARMDAAQKAPAVAPTAAAPMRITGDADFAKLPSGAVFVGPDGVTRRKP